MLLSTAGLELGIAVAIGVFAGQWLDQELGTQPWLTLALLLAGLAAGFSNLLRLVRRASRVAFPPESDDLHPPDHREDGS